MDIQIPGETPLPIFPPDATINVEVANVPNDTEASPPAATKPKRVRKPKPKKASPSAPEPAPVSVLASAFDSPEASPVTVTKKRPARKRPAKRKAAPAPKPKPVKRRKRAPKTTLPYRGVMQRVDSSFAQYLKDEAARRTKKYNRRVSAIDITRELYITLVVVKE